MSETFLRVDLRDGAQGQAHDFHKVALQPGLPLLDSANTNYRTLQKWFGVYVAQPEFRSNRPDSVGFCVCDEQQRRIVDACCEPLTENDLKSRPEIARQFEELRTKIQTTQPANPKEATLLSAIRNHFNHLTAQPGNLGFSFFKYKNGSRWQLVWLWGFERRDTKPAIAAVCKRGDCRHLIARRIDETSSCPVCQSPPMPFPKNREHSKRSCCLLGLLFLLALIAGGLLAFLKYFPTLTPQPSYAVRTVPGLEEPWTIPVGGRLNYQIFRIDGDKEHDVSDQIDVMVENPQTARIDRSSRYLRARNPGKTTVSFYLDDLPIRTIPLTVLEPTMPKSLQLDPGELTLGIGTTKQLILLGQYDDGRTIDLTEVATWKPNVDTVVSNVLGLLEGREEGKTEITASYAANENAVPLDVSCKVEVIPENYTKIEIRGVPNRLYEDFSAVIEVATKNERGEERLLTRSPRLRFYIEPPEAAFMENGTLLTALNSGKAKLRALYDTVSSKVLEDSVNFEVVQDETASHFLVQPDEMKLVVGENVLLDIVPRGPEAVIAASKDDSVAELCDGNQVVARKPGKTSIVVSQENVQREIPVEVLPADWKSIAFSPNRIFVAVDRTATLRLVGTDSFGRQREIASDQLVWETEPDPEFVQLDPFSFCVSGVKPTVEQPQIAKARCGDQTAEVQVEVLPAPLRLSMTPADSVDLPIDQQVRFAVLADYGDGDMEITPDRILWNINPETLPDGVVWEPSQGILKAEKAGVPMNVPIEVSASYQGETTTLCRVTICESAPMEIELTADRPSLHVTEQGNVFVQPKNSDSPTVPIPEKYLFKSESRTLEVDPETGQYTAVVPGKNRIIATHPAVKGEPSTPIEVEKANVSRLEIRPNNIALDVGETAALVLVKIDGEQETNIPFSRTGEPLLTTTNTGAMRIRLPNRLVGVKPAPPFRVTAEYQGMKASAIVEVLPKQPKESRKSPSKTSRNRSSKSNQASKAARTTSSGSPRSVGKGNGFGGETEDGDAYDGGNGTTSRTGKKGGRGTGGGSGRHVTTGSKLVLEGPERMTSGSEGVFTATIDGQDVTFDSTSLILDKESRKLAEPMSGCLLRGKKPGTVTVRARHYNDVSDPLQVEIEPKAEKFARLELDIDSSPMIIGERRPYKLWGYPSDGGPKQDLTFEVVTDSERENDDLPRVTVVDLPGSVQGGQIVSHMPPYLSTKATGRFGLTAAYKDYRIDSVELEVVGRTGGKTLRARPQAITLSAGEVTPPITVSVESPLDPERRIEVDAQLESANVDILAPIPGVFDRFQAEEIGRTSISVKAAGQETTIPVEVLDQPFHQVSLDRSANMLGSGRFRVFVNVEAKTRNTELEYRIMSSDSTEGQPWVSLKTDEDGRQHVRLASPELQGGAVDERYYMIIECKNKATGRRQQHPFDFRIKEKTLEVEP